MAQIGRFGLGFNAVYNVTDVPSFVSRHSIVILDPHATHLGRSIRNRAKPGVRLDVRKHRRRFRTLANQFRPFNDLFGCDLRPTARHATQSVSLPRGRQRHWNIGGRRSSAEDARIEAP